MSKALVICGFPGIGKTTAERACREAVDCESTVFHYTFDETEVNAECPAGVKKENPVWIREYVNNIEWNATCGKHLFVLASCHKEVREELDARSLPYIAIVPERNLKDEYLARYVKRGDCAEFIINVSNNWDEWLEEIEHDAPAVIHLKAGQVLSDILPIPQLRG